MSPSTRPLAMLTSAPPLLPECTAVLLCNSAGDPDGDATLAICPRVTEAPLHAVDGGNNPWPTAQTSAPSSAHEPSCHSKGSNTNGVSPFTRTAFSKATSRRTLETCSTSTSKLASTKHPLALRTNTRPLHLCELGNCQGAPVAALDFDASSTQDFPVKKWEHVRRCPSCERTTADAQLPVGSNHTQATPRRTSDLGGRRLAETWA
mmetsp:Transcript_16937/g.38003  ORF Transcript_16937/g.38003 Transcript_16937/m.38003 type:complete len:206 (+) Transcript_16937:46-663(+)